MQSKNNEEFSFCYFLTDGNSITVFFLTISASSSNLLISKMNLKITWLKIILKYAIFGIHFCSVILAHLIFKANNINNFVHLSCIVANNNGLRSEKQFDC